MRVAVTSKVRISQDKFRVIIPGYAITYKRIISPVWNECIIDEGPPCFTPMIKSHISCTCNECCLCDINQRILKKHPDFYMSKLTNKISSFDQI